MPPVCPPQSTYTGKDDFTDSSTEDSFLLYKNMQRMPNVPMPVFKKPSTRVFSKISPSVPRIRKSMISHLMHPRRKSLISSTPRYPSCKTPVSQDSSLQFSPIKARANSILAGNLESVKQTQKILNDLHPKLSFTSNTEIELRMSKSYDTQPIKKVRLINTSVRNVVEHLNREMLKKRKSIGKLVQRNSNGVLKENVTLTNQKSQQSGSFSGGSRTASTTLKSQKPKPLPSEKMHLMERETQTTDSLNKGLPKQSIGNENQNGNKTSVTLRNSFENAVNDATIDEFLEQFDADVAVHMPSIITISSASEIMSPDTTSNSSQEPPEPTNQNSYNNNTIFDAKPKIINVTLTQNNNLELSSKKEKRTVKNSSHLNVSHNTRSFKINSMSNANDDPATKAEKWTRSKNNSNRNQEQLENVHSASENIPPLISSSNSTEPPEPQSQNVKNSSQLNVSHNTRSFKINSMSNANDDPATKAEKRTRSKNNSNRNQEPLENVHSASENIPPLISSSNSTEPPEPQSQNVKNSSQLNVSHNTRSFKVNSMIKANDDPVAKEEKRTGTKRNSNGNPKQFENANSLNSVSPNIRITRSRSRSTDKNLKETAGKSRSKNEEKPSNSAAAGKKPTSKTICKSSKSNRNSTAVTEAKKYKNSKCASTAVTRKSKASTSKITNFQPYFCNRVSGFVQIEHNYPTLNNINQATEGVRRSQRPHKVPARYVQSTVVGSAPIRRRTRSVRQPAAQQPNKMNVSTISELTNADKSNLETTADNEPVFKKPQLRSSTKRRGKSRKSDVSVVMNKLKSITSSLDITDNENQADGTPLSKNYDYTEAVDSGAYTMSKEKSSLRTVTVRSSPGPSCSYWNDNVRVHSILSEQSEGTSKSPDLPVGSISNEQLQEMPENSPNVIIRENVVLQLPIENTTNLEKTITALHSQIDASEQKPVGESITKSVTFNKALLQTSKNQLDKALVPRHSNELESSRHPVQQDEGKETQNKENANAELDQNTLYTLINNEVVSVEWISQMPPSLSSKSSQGVTVTYLLNNIKTIQGTVSSGLIRFDPGQHRIQVTKKHFIVYKVEQGEATVNIQLQKRNVGVGCCFYIPLGSTYSITNLSEVEPFVLFFTKVCS